MVFTPKIVLKILLILFILIYLLFLISFGNFIKIGLNEGKMRVNVPNFICLETSILSIYNIKSIINPQACKE